MKDEEAYELLIKYCGGEKGIIMIKEMIHLVGVSGAVNNMCRAYSEKFNKTIPIDFELWMKQSFEYLNKTQRQN